MIPDIVSYIMAGVLLAISLKFQRGRLVAVVVCLSLLYDRLSFSPSMSYEEASQWMTSLFFKDLALATVMFYRGRTLEFLVGLGFIASSVSHQWFRVEFLNEADKYYAYRPDLMSVIVSCWLASIVIILLNGGSNGGRRVVNRSFSINNRLRSIFYIPAYKATK